MNLPKLKTVLICIIVLIAVIAITKPYHYEPIRNNIVEYRAKKALYSIRQLAVDQIITDEVIRATIRNNEWGNLRGLSWAAREAIFAELQCPIFNFLYNNVEKTCETARYAEGSAEDNWYYKKAGIPGSISPVIAEMRAVLYSKGRDYFLHRSNLNALYAVKKKVILDEYNHLSDENKSVFRSMLLDAIGAFEQFRGDMLTRIIYIRYIRDEEAYRLSNGSYQDHVSSLTELSEATVDMAFYLFAGRRDNEGGDTLVTTYLLILKDLWSEVEPKKLT